MKKFFNAVFHTEYLPMTDVRKLKILVIFIFLLGFTIITIPVSRYLDYPTWVKIVFLIGFGVGSMMTYIFYRFNYGFLSMQTTIIQAVMFMVYYTQGITSFYAYLLFYIVLTIIAFYQEIYSYFVFGSFVLLAGIFYLLTDNQSLLLSDDLEGAIYIYIVGLFLYFFVNLIYIFMNEKAYSEMNLEWIKDKKTNDSMQKDIFNYMEGMRKISGNPPIFEETEFNQAIHEISKFIAKQIFDDGEEIKNIVELYAYMHESGYQSIIDNQEISIPMRKTTVSLKKYMVDDHSDLLSLMNNFVLKNRISNIDMGDLSIHKLTSHKDELLIAFGLIYVYLEVNLCHGSTWNKFNDDSMMKSLKDFDFEEFFDDYILAFYRDNEEIIRKNLSK